MKHKLIFFQRVESIVRARQMRQLTRALFATLASTSGSRSSVVSGLGRRVAAAATTAAATTGQSRRFTARRLRVRDRSHAHRLSRATSARGAAVHALQTSLAHLRRTKSRILNAGTRSYVCPQISRFSECNNQVSTQRKREVRGRTRYAWTVSNVTPFL